MSNDIDFPTLEEARLYIEKLKKVNWPKFNENHKVEDYLKLVEDILYADFKNSYSILQLFKTEKFTLPFFRVRPYQSFTNIDLFSEHSFPPIDVTPKGRCNFPKHPVFYCSNEPITALLEVARNENKNYCISKWKLHNSDSEIAFQTFMQTKLHDNNNFKTLKDSFEENLKKSIGRDLDDEKMQIIIEFWKFINESFIDDVDYSLSASITHRMFYAPHNYSTDILMYPSVQTNLAGVNMAIHPNFVNNNMFIDRLYIIRYVDYEAKTGRIQIIPEKIGLIKKNTIFWDSFNYNNELHRNAFSEDFKNLKLSEDN